MVYVGVDLHRKRSHVAAVDAEGQLLLSRRIDNDPGEFLRIFGELGPNPWRWPSRRRTGGVVRRSAGRRRHLHAHVPSPRDQGDHRRTSTMEIPLRIDDWSLPTLNVVKAPPT